MIVPQMIRARIDFTNRHSFSRGLGQNVRKENPGAADTATGARFSKQTRTHGTQHRRFQQDARSIAQVLSTRIESLALSLLGEPSLKRHHEWRWGAHGSLVVNVGGAWRGRWRSFEEGRGGDALDLIAWQRGCSIGDAMRWARDWLGGAS